MWKKAAVGAAALVVAGSMMVSAQQRGGFDGPRGYDGPRDTPHMHDWHPSAQDLSAFAEARIAALHAGLQLNADQEKNWPPVEQSLRDLSRMRIERFSAARDQQQQPSQQANPLERLQRRADMLITRGAALKRLADAAAPLYQSLDDAQKRRLTMLVRFMRAHELHRMGHERFGGEHERFGDHDGMRRDGFHMGPQRFGEDHGMRGPHERDGMTGMGGRDDDEDDYQGPL
jgi:zinc resistance-associated protein